MAGVFWRGNDGNIYTKQAGVGVTKQTPEQFYRAQAMNIAGAGNLRQITNPSGVPEVSPAQQAANDVASAPSYTDVGSYDPAAAQQAREEQARMQRVNDLRSGVLGNHQALLDAYNLLFGDIDNMARERSGEVEKRAGESINELTEQYTGSLPGIANSYAAIGAGDSTDKADAKDAAKAGHEKSVKQVGENKKSDLAKIGSYVTEQKSKWNADRDSINRLMGRVNETEDEGDLRASRNQAEDKLGSLRAERATLTTDAGARGELSKITNDGGRFDSIKQSLDSIVNSSMAGGTKAAAVQAVMGSADLTDEDKNKVKLMYGDVYNAV